MHLRSCLAAGLVVFAFAPPCRAAAVHDAVDPVEAKRVLDAVFPKYLTGPCPAVAGVDKARTWGELDALQASAHRRGLFRPEVRQRVDGSFTAAGADEVLYTVALHECVGNGWDGWVDVVFARGTTKPRVRIDHGDWGAGGFRIVAVESVAGIDTLVAVASDRRRTLRLSPPGAARPTWVLVDGTRVRR